MATSTTLELWQTEWCPASHRVRQCLTELGLSYVVHQVPVDADARTELQAATGAASIPVLVADGAVVNGEQRILSYLGDCFPEPPDALMQRQKAAKAKHKELEEACLQLAATTP